MKKLKSIKNEIRKKLLDKNKTMKWLAKEMNVSIRTFYRKIERNDIDFICKINDVLNEMPNYKHKSEVN